MEKVCEKLNAQLSANIRRYEMITQYDFVVEHLELIIGVIGIIIAIFFWIRSRKFKRVAYLLRTFKITEKKNEIPKLRVMYGNEIVENLSLSRIAVFNDGNQVIDISDMSKKDPLRIVIPKDFRILDARLFYVRNEANNFSLEISREENAARIIFDYMNGGDGCVVEIFYDSTVSDDITVRGSFKGIRKIDKKGQTSKEFRNYLIFIVLFILYCLWIQGKLLSLAIPLYLLLSVVLGLLPILLYEFLYGRYIKKFLMGNVKFYESIVQEK